MNKFSNLSERTEKVILGTLLGDGSLRIHDRYKNPRLSFRHSVKQEKYFFWKVSQLQEISGRRHWWRQEPSHSKCEGKVVRSGEMLRYQSRALVELQPYYQLVSPRGGKEIRRKWLNQLSPLSLAIWWLDDGSIVANGRKGVICTDSFTEKGVKRMARYLQVEWDINTNPAPQRSREGQWRLYFTATSELKKFLRVIMPVFPPDEEMLYKVLLLYHDPDLQQRWMSEVSEMTGFAMEVVARVLEDRKRGWQKFSSLRQ